MTSRREFKELMRKIQNCRVCRDRFGFEPRPLVWGDYKAKIVQISQAPSLSVHESQKPFCDKSGERLRREWYQISDEDFYNPENFYITAIAHCYPGRTRFGDRSPPIVCAKTWLVREVELLDPQLFVVIGSFAARFLFPGRDFTALVMEDQGLCGKECLVLPHPSPVNIRWFKDNPEFKENRLPQVRRHIKTLLR